MSEAEQWRVVAEVMEAERDEAKAGYRELAHQMQKREAELVQLSADQERLRAVLRVVRKVTIIDSYKRMIDHALLISVLEPARSQDGQ